MSLAQSASPSSVTDPDDEDVRARVRILSDLDTSMMVEAGAGSGKTTSLVGRMAALVARGTAVERIAAVTFTRKAANELRERFQVELERRFREGGDNPEMAQRYDRALREIDRAFLGTIHAFCGRLLRERPLEVGLDPDFRELDEDEFAEAKQEFWRRWIERASRDADPDVVAARTLGVDLRALRTGFDQVIAYPDVQFPLPDSQAPDVTQCRRQLEVLLARAAEIMPRTQPGDGWDPLMTLIRRLHYSARVHDWQQLAAFCGALERMAPSHCKPTQKRWSSDKAGKQAAKQLGEDFLSFLEGPVAELLRCWREHRYPVVMRLLLGASEAFARERHATGRLCFEDLLLLTARLLREHPAARAGLGERYSHLLVDEFQDTDPVQAEICFLLTSAPGEGIDWRTATPRPGSLFVVGDPKQSIFRFRRADIQTYEMVRARLEQCGAVLKLTRNFRSVRPIETLVNTHFGTRFPAAPTAHQAPFSPLRTQRDGIDGDGVFRYPVTPDGRSKEAIAEADAQLVASWIAERVGTGRNVPRDFLLITYHKQAIAAYARALSARNIPSATTGAPLPQEHELRELITVLAALADPENSVAVVAALEGLFFGLSPADLYEGREAGLRFSVTHPPRDATHVVSLALGTLHEWWRAAQRHPADVLVERILADTGLLYHAASQELGDARAGALLHIVEALRAGSLTGAPGIVDAMERIEILLRGEAGDAPLRPGRHDAVRIMNLHKAKGLEAEVVVLCAPSPLADHDPTVCIRRDGDHATGGMLIEGEPRGRGAPIPLAQPPRWDAMAADERLFGAAELDRLLYVAITRARRALVVASRVGPATSQAAFATSAADDQSLWGSLAGTLATCATAIGLPATPAPGRRRVSGDCEALARRAAAAAERTASACAPTTRSVTVTESAKHEREERRAYDLAAVNGMGAGPAWGRAVHRSLEALGRGRRGASLQIFMHAVVRDEGLSTDVLPELAAMVAQVSGSAAWQRLTATGRLTVELPVMQCELLDGVMSLTEGVIDAAALGADGWVVVDWKTDRVEGEAWDARARSYDRQVARYCEMLAALGGEPARGSVERVRS